MKCTRCKENEAIAGLVIGGQEEQPICYECAADFLDIPRTLEQAKMACGNCARRIREIPVFFANKFWHQDCLQKQITKCPKCSQGLSKSGDCNYCNFSFSKLLDQAYKDSFVIFERGGIGKTCTKCLNFNSATSLGLPLYPQEPWPTEHVCAICHKGTCSKHMAHTSKDNVLGIDPKLPICSAGWVSSCYQDLIEQVACTAPQCETTEQNYDGERWGWDPLVNSKQCEQCSAWFCNLDHEECPQCVGTECDGCETKIVDDVSAYHVQEGWQTHRVCEDCYSGMTCYGCAESMADPGEEWESYGGFCQWCAVKEGTHVECSNCSNVPAIEDAKRYIESPHDTDSVRAICSECAGESYYAFCEPCAAYHDRSDFNIDLFGNLYAH